MVDIFADELAQRTVSEVWQAPSLKTISSPAPILDGKPPEELELEWRETRPNLLSCGEAGATCETRKVGRFGAELSGRRELPPENIWGVGVEVYDSQPRPELQILHHSVDRERATDVPRPCVGG
jgi:hypothetical protein